MPETTTVVHNYHFLEKKIFFPSDSMFWFSYFKKLFNAVPSCIPMNLKIYNSNI